MQRWLMVLLTCGFLHELAAAPLEFALGKQQQQAIETADLVQQIHLSRLSAHDPAHEGPVDYEGLALNAVLDRAFGQDWHQYDAVAFSSRDGYTPSVPVATVERVRGLIAVNEAGRSGFALIRQPNGETIDPGPAYLVWDNIGTLDAVDREWLAWPWQLTRIALYRYQDLYPHSVPTATSSTAVKHGATVFQQHCIRCHTLNGEGGTIGPELNVPDSVTERFQSAWLERWIREPRSIRPTTTMPALPLRTAEDRTRLDDLLAYLQYMAQHKRASP
jgi:mono/diheme cytochrome c family protein